MCTDMYVQMCVCMFTPQTLNITFRRQTKQKKKEKKKNAIYLVLFCLFDCLFVKYLYRLYFYIVIRVNRWSAANSLPSSNSLFPGL